MKDRPEDLSRVVNGLEPPPPPARLRDLVIATATPVLARPVVLDPWRRVWESRPARLAWAATVTILIAAHMLLPRSQPSALAHSGVPAGPAREALAAELREVTSLPRINSIELRLEPSRDLSSPRPEPASSPSPQKESKS